MIYMLPSKLGFSDLSASFALVSLLLITIWWCLIAFFSILLLNFHSKAFKAKHVILKSAEKQEDSKIIY